MSLHVRISPVVLEEGGGWSPSLFSGRSATARRAGTGNPTISDLGARLIEGWRSSETPGTAAFDARATATPVYRQSNIGRFHLELGRSHWSTPDLSGRWCVQPGDVVVNKQAPIRAALVPGAARRHPVDGNSVLVRGLSSPHATWLAACLNRPEYEGLLLIESGIGRRVGLGMLAALRLPPLPHEVVSLSEPLRQLLDERVLIEEDLHRVLAEAAGETVTDIPDPDGESGGFVSRAALSNDSWLPGATRLRARHAALAERHGWVPLHSLARGSGRSRLSRVREDLRVLRLGDVGEDLLVRDGTDLSGSHVQLARILDGALVPGEVLVSTLATSPRAAYVDEAVSSAIHPIDGWVRLRFQETPAAWSLLLATPEAGEQIGKLAVGNVLQFVPPEAVLSVHVPEPDRTRRERWQQAVERHHAQRRDLDRRWAVLHGELDRAFDRVHQPYGRSAPHAEESVER